MVPEKSYFRELKKNIAKSKIYLDELLVMITIIYDLSGRLREDN